MGHKSHTPNSQGRNGNKKGRGVFNWMEREAEKGKGKWDHTGIRNKKGDWREQGGGVGRGGSKINGRWEIRKNERVKAREKDLRGRCYIVGEVTFQQLVVPLRVN